jgi:hypothetical protein
MAAACRSSRWPGAYLNDEMLSNVAKHNVTRPFEIARLAGHRRRPRGHHAIEGLQNNEISR